MNMKWIFALLLLCGQAWGQVISPGAGVPASGGSFTGPVNFPNYGIVQAATAHDEVIGTDGFVNDGVHSTSLSTMFSTGGGFTAALVGKAIVVDGCGIDSTDLITTIASVQNSNNLTLATPCTYATPWSAVGRAYLATTATVTQDYALADILSLSGGTSVAGPTGTVTFTNGSAVIGWTGNTLVAGALVQFSTTGGLPTGFSPNTNYYVSWTGLTPSQLEVSATVGGVPIVAGSAGSGTQTANVQPAAGQFTIKSLGVNNPTVLAGSTGGTNGACLMTGTTGVTNTQPQGPGRPYTSTASNGYFELSGTVSGGALTLPVITQPGDYNTKPRSNLIAPFNMTFSNGSAIITASNSLITGDTVRFSTTGGLPTNFAINTTYYVIATGLSGSQFEVSATAGGSAILAGSAGSGTQTTTVVEAMTVLTGCGSITNVAVSFFMGPQYLMQTTPGHYTALPAAPWTVTGGSGAGATLTPYGLGVTGRSITPIYNGDLIGGFWAYGTDDSDAINTAIALAQADGGGTVLFPSGRSLMLSAFNIVYTGTSPPIQKSLMLMGSGSLAPTSNSGAYGNDYAQPVTGTIIDNYYAGGDASGHIAKLDTRGVGNLGQQNITFSDHGTDNYLFKFNTNTLPRDENLAILGNATCYESSCIQNGLRFGNINGTVSFGTNSADGCFQQNAAHTTKIYFSFIQEAYQIGCAANEMVIDNIQVSSSSGSWLTAPIHYYGSGAGSNGGVVLAGEVEMTGYPYTVYMDHVNATNTAHVFLGLAAYDNSGDGTIYNGAPTRGGFFFDASSFNNAVLSTPLLTDIIYSWINQATQGSNMILNSGGTFPEFNNGLNVVSGTLNVKTRTPIGTMATFGPGTGLAGIVINGGQTNSGDGGKLEFYNGSSLCAAIGEKSAVLGGAYSAILTINSNCNSIRLGLFNNDEFDVENGIVTVKQQFYTNSGAPTIASGGCGATTNGVAAGDNQSGTITIGAASTATCQVTFSGTLAKVPHSVILTPGNAAAAALGSAGPYVSALSSSGFTLTAVALANTIWYYTTF